MGELLGEGGEGLLQASETQVLLEQRICKRQRVHLRVEHRLALGARGLQLRSGSAFVLQQGMEPHTMTRCCAALLPLAYQLGMASSAEENASHCVGESAAVPEGGRLHVKVLVGAHMWCTMRQGRAVAATYSHIKQIECLSSGRLIACNRLHARGAGTPHHGAASSRPVACH